MAPQKRKQVYRRRQRQAPVQGSSPSPDHVLDAEARRLVETHSVEQLHSLLAQVREAYDWADRQAQDRPSPEALRHYRSAARALAEAQRALSIATALNRND